MRAIEELGRWSALQYRFVDLIALFSVMYGSARRDDPRVAESSAKWGRKSQAEGRRLFSSPLHDI